MGDFHLRNYSEDIMAEGVNKEFMRTLAHILLPHVYVVGTAIHSDSEENVNIAIDVADELYTTGICLPIIPALTYYWEKRHPRGYEFYNEYCFQIMKRCDAVFVDEVAEGADWHIDELAEAQRLGLPIFWSTGDLQNWVEDGAE